MPPAMVGSYMERKGVNRMSKRYKTIVLSAVLVCLGMSSFLWGYVEYRKWEVEQAVTEYLGDKGIKKSKIVSLESFIANLRGDQNYMVAVKLKDDERTYYYYKDQESDDVVFESYVDNQKVYAPDEFND